MKNDLYEKTQRVEIVSMTDNVLTVQNEGNENDQWEIDRETFDDTYSPELKDFGWAIRKLKEGQKVCRSGWNGKGMWIALMPELYLDKDIINGRTKKHIGEGVDLDSQPYIVMWTAAGQWQPGWLCSQADMLATDWEVVE